MMETVKTSKAPQAIGPYSQAVISGGFVFLSGQIPLTPDGQMVEGTISDQVKQVLDNIKAVLEEAGTSLEKVVKVTIFLADLGNFGEVNSVYEKYFTHKPARSTVQASLPKGAQVEIDAIAAL